MMLFDICCFLNATACNISFFGKCPFDPTVKGLSFVKKGCICTNEVRNGYKLEQCMHLCEIVMHLISVPFQHIFDNIDTTRLAAYHN